MTECQGCGAWNAASRTLCVLCDTPLAETDEWDAAAEPPPLPPLPDGGLRGSMPFWLRESPLAPLAAPLSPLSAASPPSPPLVASEPEAAPLGPRADPRTFLGDDDFPPWLRGLAARRDETAPATPTAPAAPVRAERFPPDWPKWPEPSAPSPAPVAADSDAALVAAITEGAAPAPSSASAPLPAPAPDGRPSAAAVAARALEERRHRDPWETLLLVLLCIGVVVAALWALVSNGVFSPGL